MTLQQRNDETKQLIIELKASIEQDRQALAQKELKAEKLITKATNEAKVTERVIYLVSQVSELLSDASGVYGDLEAIDHIVDEFVQAGENIKDNFETHKNKTNNQYLEKQQTGDKVVKVSETTQQLSIVESDEMPEVDDKTTPLTRKNAKDLISHLDKKQLNKLSVFNEWGNLTSVDSVAKAIEKARVTRYELENFLDKYLDRNLLAS